MTSRNYPALLSTHARRKNTESRVKKSIFLNECIKTEVLMVLIKALLTGFVGVSLCMADISGIVTDTGATPISGAVVQLEKDGQTATSGSDGSFTLVITPTAILPSNGKSLPNGLSARISGTMLTLAAFEQTALEIATFDLNGKALSTVRKTMDAGSYCIGLPQRGAGVYLYKVKTGKMEFVIKGNAVGGINYGSPATTQGTSMRGLVKQAKAMGVINDVIAATKPGWLNYRCGIGNSDTSGIVIEMIACADTVNDADGNLYHAVKIGNQVWTVENLKTTKYNDGTAITYVSDSAAWYNLHSTDSIMGVYCYYGNNSVNKENYGALYNWYAVISNKLAPEGWRVPTLADWDTLENYLIANGYNDDTATGDNIAKSMAARTDWQSNTIAGVIGNDLCKNNASGFSALPGGFRGYDGTFNAQSYYGFWWSATEYNESDAWYRNLYFDASYLSRYNIFKSCGFSVRLLRNLK
jgi:uncharacterized protein (TIGR02145 family)